jgi:hypothetical protein
VKPPAEGSIFVKKRRSPLPWLIAAGSAAGAALAWWFLGG